ncbi:energy transducer TonB [Acidobacteria bacterium AB60]|nr:energy transducer TonB [Acidobacteria bacterium AB60]
MPVNELPIRANFGLLPEPQRNAASLVTSAAVNLTILALILYIGMTAKRVIQAHKYEHTELIFPTTPPPPPLKMKMPTPPKIAPPKPMEQVKLEAPKINIPKPEPKPEVKPIQMEAKLNVPVIKQEKPAIVLAPQPKAALAAAAAPAQVTQPKPSTAAVHLGETFGVTPNAMASKPATVAAIGNPYGGMNGPAAAPRGVVGSTGLGNGSKAGSNAGVVGKVASAGIPGASATGNNYNGGKVASAGIPQMQQAAVATPAVNAVPKSTNLEVISKPPVQYTSEARQLKVQGDVVLRVTFTASGQVLVQGVVHGLGHGLDEEARRVASQIRFRPATRDGQPVDLTTNITITFQLA